MTWDDVAKLCAAFAFVGVAAWFAIEAGASGISTLSAMALPTTPQKSRQRSTRGVLFSQRDLPGHGPLTAPAMLSCAEFVGPGGHDCLRGPINSGLFKPIKWAGTIDPTKPVVKFDRANGCVWRGILIPLAGVQGATQSSH